MPEPPRRKRFQIHLSTAVVLMIAAGVLIWANVMPHEKIRWWKRVVQDVRIHDVEYGWPLTAWMETVNIEAPVSDINRDTTSVTLIVYGPSYRYANLAGDVLIALSSLFAVWFFCEWIIRRRAARKCLNPPIKQGDLLP